MSILGSAFGFLYPAALLAFPIGLALLIYAYLRRGRGERFVVATVLLLKGLERHARARKKFVPPPRFFYELFLLTLLALGAAGLYQEAPKRNIAVLLDNSFSMGAKNTSTLVVRSRLEEAKQAVQQFLVSVDGGSQIQLFTPAPVLTAVTNGFVDVDQAVGLLDLIELTYAPDNLAAALYQLALRPELQQIAVFSDKQAEVDPAKSAGDRIRFYPLAGQDSHPPQNIAVAEAAFTQPEVDTGLPGLRVALDSFGSAEVPVEVTLSGAEVSGVNLKLLPVAKMRTVIAAQGRATVLFKDLPPQAAAFQIKLGVSSPKAAALDVIQEDNQAWITVDSSGRKILVVSPWDLETLGLAKLTAFQFIGVKPESFKADALTKEYQGAVFHRVAPAQLPETNTLLVFPEGGSFLGAASPAAANPLITRWIDSHPLLRYLNLDALTLPSAAPLAAPAWAEVVVNSTVGPLLIAAERGNLHVAATGFELFPYQGKRSPFLSVLTLNLLKWLSESDFKLGFQNTYSRLPLTPGLKEVSYFEGERLQIQSGPEADGVLLPHPGLTILRGGHGTARLAAVNFINTDESNVLKVQKVSLPNIAAKQDDQLQQILYSESLAKLLLFALILELLLLTKGFGLLRRQVRSNEL